MNLRIRLPPRLVHRPPSEARPSRDQFFHDSRRLSASGPALRCGSNRAYHPAATKGKGKSGLATDSAHIRTFHPHAGSWFSFSRVLSLLPARYHAYALDQRGHGDSERPACCYTIDDLATDIVAFLDGVGTTRAILVGHSASGFIARRLAETHPDRVARLVLINCAVTLPTQVRREMEAAVQGLQDPLPVAFARELHASVAHLPLPERIFEWLVARASRRLPASGGTGCEWSRRRATARTWSAQSRSPTTWTVHASGVLP
jgi:pimeloyl-ACP methyl ester carboxylesterase